MSKSMKVAASLTDVLLEQKYKSCSIPTICHFLVYEYCQGCCIYPSSNTINPASLSVQRGDFYFTPHRTCWQEHESAMFLLSYFLQNMIHNFSSLSQHAVVVGTFSVPQLFVFVSFFYKNKLITNATPETSIHCTGVLHLQAQPSYYRS